MGFDHISHWSKLKITHKIVYISGGGLGMRNVTRLFGYKLESPRIIQPHCGRFSQTTIFVHPLLGSISMDIILLHSIIISYT